MSYAIAAATSDVIELSQALLKEASITPHDANCQKILTEKLYRLGFRCESMRFHDVDNLWARYGQEEPLLVFAGHTDVVPTGPENLWASPPFAPQIREGKLYARGACDMKCNIAAMVVAIEAFLHQYPQFPGSIAFLITSDEEGPAIHGTRKVLEALMQRQEKITYCVVGEPSSDTTVGDQIRVGRRGSLHGHLIVKGKQGHVAHPHLAHNPIHHAALALHDLAHTVWDQGNEHFPPTTFQISNINAGTGAKNIIPGSLEVIFNFRFSTAVTPEQLQTRSETIFNHYGLEYTIEWEVSGYPFLTAPESKLIAATVGAIETIIGTPPRLSTGGGTSDGRFIAQTGAEVVELGVSHATAHQIDECVSVEDLNKLVNIYIQLLKNLF